MKKKYKTKKSTILPIMSSLLLISALLSILYPVISCLASELNDNTVITAYTENVKTLSQEDKNIYLDSARDYNRKLTDIVSTESFIKYDEKENNYNDILNVNNGIMGSVTIPKINVELPIYHGISDEVLSNGVGHMPNTSFPIGGKSTHAVISAHTAYPGKVFFDDLPELDSGDIFYINILGDTLTYKIFNIEIVDPDNTNGLRIVDGKDYVSLLTCYPYAVNTHRLIVTGERIETNDATEDSVIQTQTNHSPNYILLFSIVLILTIAIIITLIISFVKHMRIKKILK